MVALLPGSPGNAKGGRRPWFTIGCRIAAAMTPDPTRDRLAALEELVRREGRGRWLVLTHDNPDPDALASATLLALVLRRALGQRVTAAYGGIVGRAENREMLRSLHLPFSHVRHLNFKHYRHFALVDTQPRTGNNQLPRGTAPDVVFDHHPLRKATSLAAFCDVRPAYGATATILAEYMLAAGIEPTHAVATALIYAIRSETLDFSREFTGPDKAVFDRFFPRADHRLLARIQSPRLPVAYFRNLHEALERLETVDSLVMSHLGEVDQPDIVPEIADLLLRIEGKTWSLATGFFGERLYLSIRTTNPRADAGALMQRLLGRRGKGGGHGRTGGGWLDAARVAPEDRRRLQETLARRLAVELRKNPEKIAPLALRPGGEGAPAGTGAPGSLAAPAGATPAAGPAPPGGSGPVGGSGSPGGSAPPGGSTPPASSTPPGASAGPGVPHDSKLT
jgi:nanoRNase/pAp phosphatase (c-di-AMP/oligoRNAs hydrolase)